jgi:hypothetical protein
MTCTHDTTRYRLACVPWWTKPHGLTAMLGNPAGFPRSPAPSSTSAATASTTDRTRWGHPARRPVPKRVAFLDSSHAKEGIMNAEIWIELAIVLLRILAAGLSG